MIILDWFLERSGFGKRLRALELKTMKTEEAVAALEQARKDQAEANAEVVTKFTELNARVIELEAMVANGELPEALASKIAEVVTGAKALADVIPGAPEQA
jgi:hypothetical protein